MRFTLGFVTIVAAAAAAGACVGPTVTSSPPESAAPTVARPASPTPTPTSSPTPRPTEPPTPVATVAATPAPALECAVQPEGGFLGIWQGDPLLQGVLGCPTSDHPRITPQAWMVSTAYQPFERGVMIWSNQIGWFPQPVIYVVYDDGTYQRFDDAFDPGVDPTGGGETPPEGLVEPVLGFGKIWREESGVRDRLGWATASESSGSARFQLFAGGDMIWLSQTDRTYVFVFSTGAAHVFDVPF